MSLYAFHLGQIISTVLGQVDHDGQHGNAAQGHRLSKDRCVTSVKKLSHGRHLPSKCRSRDYSSFGSTSLPSKMFSTPFLQL
jgi:hypothetical protein